MVKPNPITLLSAPGFRSRFTLEPAGVAPNLPNLWQVAGQMHERILIRIASPEKLSHTARMPYNERHGLLAWIEPVEHLVRLLLIASAITFLLMTVKGRKLLKDTRKVPLPTRAPSLRPLAREQDRIVMPHPGWRTIANAPRPLASPAAPEPAAADSEEREPHQPSMSLDPKTWTCPFSVLRWRFPEQDKAKPRPAAFDMLLESMRDPHIPLRTSLNKHALQSAQQNSAQQKHPRHSGNPVAVNLARRLEAVGRVLANPQRHIMRVARYIARLPAGLLDQDFELPPSRRFWQQGREAFTGAVRLLCSAIRALNLCQLHDPEPG